MVSDSIMKQCTVTLYAGQDICIKCASTLAKVLAYMKRNTDKSLLVFVLNHNKANNWYVFIDVLNHQSCHALCRTRYLHKARQACLIISS
jgi:hypothetical protein